MTVTNKTSYNITLVDGTIINRYSTKEIYNPSKEVIDQLKNLSNNDIVKVEY